MSILVSSLFLFGTTEMAFTTGHNLHRLRQGTFYTFFPKALVQRLEPLIRGRVNAVYQQLMKRADIGTPVNLARAASTQNTVIGYRSTDRRSVRNGRFRAVVL